MVGAAMTGQAGVVDRGELGGFLRRCRERLQPGDVGLAAGSRRRTPGLRRQEVAQLAGMSVDYLTRLEQGRGPRPSRQLLSALSRALRLSDAECDYLHRLVGETPAPPAGPDRDVRPGLVHLLDRLADTPAIVLDAAYGVLAWNPMGAALLGDFSALPVTERNLIWRFFSDPAARARHDEAGADDFGRAAVAALRAAAARYPADRGVADLVRRLRAASAEFAGLWTARDVRAAFSSTKRIRHPVLGWLELECEGLHDPYRDQWVIFYTAAPGTPCAEALGLLRVIGTQDLAPVMSTWREPEVSAAHPGGSVIPARASPGGPGT
jgi:transcriptional regulator with XRE-family HTH domain